MQNRPGTGEIIPVKTLESGKIYIREQSGWFQRIRRALNLGLFGLFILLPLIQYDGRQAILFDVGAQTLNLFAVTLYPHDLMVFALLFIAAAFVLFYVTKRFGRVWCGFSCPQTVWTLLFNWIERRVEGSHHQSRKLDSALWGRQKVMKKALKHLAWLAVSLLTALCFMAYFVPVTDLYHGVFTLSGPNLVLGWVAFFTACTYVNAGWIREKMCLHICPYARFQSVMFDAKTSLVTYDAARGEGRGPRKRNARPAGLGDCVDCRLCVQVCPVGIDIRNGLQYECINCGLCADACDSVMQNFRYPTRLIRFQSNEDAALPTRGTLGYALASAMTLAAFFAWWGLREDTEMGLQRDRQALYRINQQGAIENTYTLTILNKTQQAKSYGIALQGLEDGHIRGATQLSVPAGEKREIPVSVATRNDRLAFPLTVQFRITDLRTGDQRIMENRFYGGEGAW